MYKTINKLQHSFLDFNQPPGLHMNPQDISLLNEAREKLKSIIVRFCKAYGFALPRRYRRKARKDYLAFAKGKRHSGSQVRKAIRRRLSHVCGKVNVPVEFGAKLGISLDEKCYARVEKVSFEPYNESGCLEAAVERYRERTGHYPERVPADQIYRTRVNRSYCKLHGIRLSGPKPGRKGGSEQTKTEKRTEYQDNTDRIVVEREFSVEKHSYGLGKIVTRLESTQLTSIALSVFVSNLLRIRRRILYAFLSAFEIVYIPAGWAFMPVA